MRYCIIILLCIKASALFSQENKDFFSWSEKKQTKFLTTITTKFSKLEKQIAEKSKKTLKRLEKQEQQIYKRLKKKDSLAAKQFLLDSKNKYAALQQKLESGASSNELKEYLPMFDSLKTGLSFLNTNNINKDLSGKLNLSTQSLKQFEGKMQAANEIKQAIKERKQFLNEQLKKYDLRKQLKQISKETYYYQQQLSEYKSLVSDPKKIEQKALSLLRGNTAFKSFMQKNSMLAQLFKLPDNYGSPESLNGLQTRASVQQLLNQRFAGAGVNPQQHIQQQMQAAQAELNNLKNKVNKVGGSGSDLDMPENFKSNNQKTKSFFKRLEYGANVQTQKMNSLIPVTSDIALTLGYKLNDKSIIGIGAAYKLGLGNGWKNLKLTHEGVGLRSFIDYKIKGTFWLTGGYEQNYNQTFGSIQQLKDISAWRQSGLLGLMKKIKIGKKKQSNVQLLYDFLYRQNNIQTQPLLFRVGYSFN